MVEQQVFIIGAQRSGTTYLYRILDAHPQIQMAKPVSPEPKFFFNETEFAKGREYYMEKYFSELPAEKIIVGEKSTSYIEFELVAQRIKSFFPDAKILVMLRNPVARAISNYLFSAANGLETRTLEEVFLEEKPAPQLSAKISVSPFNYLGRGNYVSYLLPYMNLFKEKMKVLIFEETVSDPQAIRNIYRFIGAEETFLPANISEVINAGKKDATKVSDKQVRDKLFEFYKPAVHEMEELLGRKIPAWNKSS